MSSAEERLSEVLGAFDFGAPVVGAIRYGNGHINDTFVVHTQPEDCCCRRFILQRMSPAAFKRPDQLMENITGVTDYLGREIEQHGGERDREALRVIRPRNGEPYYTDQAGGAWRLYPFVERTICYQTAETPELFASSGRAFGRFQRLLQGYPAETLHETIPHFHDTEDRLRKLKEAVAADSMDRVKLCQPEIDFILAREADCSVALKALREGVLPLRVTHNDTKLNNVLMDETTGEGMCIIDLDTVMPGLSINDFGDSIRFGANHSAEDETDLSKVNLDVELFATYTAAFLEGAGGTLTKAEVKYLPWGAKLMTLECGIRFLTDYLVGDEYFHISREHQNLDRCRTQCKLVSDMEAHWDELNAIVERCASLF
ncbi:MAG: aminoglycoside phosphotransferase family protein [Oscillospiraceae bacterium]|nr:aminoglycoside phosphotransferase family protein [Oscillospiraceae bacterium]